MRGSRDSGTSGDASGRGSDHISGPVCESCGQSLAGGKLTLPWEGGSNANAYVRCPHCGHKNIVYGYGEDDD